MKIFTLREIVAVQTPIQMSSPSAIGRHIIEEVSEIPSLLMRGEDVPFPTTQYKLSEVQGHLDELTDDQKEEYTRYFSFYRWNRGADAQRFKDQLESDLIDIVMMVGVYIYHLRQWIPNFPPAGIDLDSLLDYRFDLRIAAPSEATTDKWLETALDIAKAILRFGNVIDFDDIPQSTYAISKCFQHLGDLLPFVEKMCLAYGIDVNAGIQRKIGELKGQKRSQ